MNPTKQSPSWGANGSSVSQEILRILCNPKVRSVFTNSPPLAPIPSNINHVHIISPYLFKINFNIIIPSTLRSSTSSLYFRFPHQNPVRISLRPTHTTCLELPHSPRLHQPNNIWCGVQIMKLLFVQFSSASCYFLSTLSSTTHFGI
jgi:hypothetical protein